MVHLVEQGLCVAMALTQYRQLTEYNVEIKPVNQDIGQCGQHGLYSQLIFFLTKQIEYTDNVSTEYISLGILSQVISPNR
mgnify:CR=1 FL=1